MSTGDPLAVGRWPASGRPLGRPSYQDAEVSLGLLPLDELLQPDPFFLGVQEVLHNHFQQPRLIRINPLGVGFQALGLEAPIGQQILGFIQGGRLLAQPPM